jgi:hypothetical protein
MERKRKDPGDEILRGDPTYPVKRFKKAIVDKGVIVEDLACLIEQYTGRYTAHNDLMRKIEQDLKEFVVCQLDTYVPSIIDFLYKGCGEQHYTLGLGKIKAPSGPSFPFDPKDSRTLRLYKKALLVEIVRVLSELGYATTSCQCGSSVWVFMRSASPRKVQCTNYECGRAYSVHPHKM